MPTNILMPALSPTMEKGKLAKWLKKEGDQVKSGDILAEIETDKATMEVEAVDEGTVGKILIAEGTDDVAVNTPIAVLLGEGEKATDIKARRRSEAPPPPRQPRPEKPRLLTKPAAPPKTEAPQPAAASQRARRTCFRFALGAPDRQGKGHRPRGAEWLRAAWPHRAQGCREAQSPAPRHRPPSAPAATALAAPMADDAIAKIYEPGTYEVVPHDGMRKIIAQRLLQAKQTIPHFYLSISCDLENLLAVRERLNAHAPRDKDKNAGLEAFGQRLRHQGAGAGAAARARRQCHLDRRRHAQAQAFRCRRRGGSRRRAVHAGHPQGRNQDPVADFARDEGSRGRARASAGWRRRNIRAAPPPSPISACSASRISPPSSIRRMRRSSRSARARSAPSWSTMRSRSAPR